MRTLAAAAVALLTSFAAGQDHPRDSPPPAAPEPLVAAAADPAIDWFTDLASARAAAAEQHKPLLLLFRCER